MFIRSHDALVALAVEVEVAVIEVEFSKDSIDPWEIKDELDEFPPKRGSWSQIPNTLNLLKIFNVLKSRR